MIPPDPHRLAPPWLVRYTRFVDKGTEYDDCWLWTGATDEDGYGKFRMPGGRVVGVHIIAWEFTHERMVPKGWEVDHRCRIRRCCNPDHLEAVPKIDNTLRGEGVTAKNARKTHCPRGHEYTNTNTRYHHGSRECITCIRQRDRERRRAKKTEDVEINRHPESDSEPYL